ncbi:hypothetical protein [Mycobacterium sp. 1423905.2]|uniref:hypothetical protein n=1 Tax=Mycobacterium sp. 1423905.2 TaxID=1856859 RepID=UPI0007FC7C8F|nr:hypothetical protein [Mycobacterium sp. 1423905.2]OBJ61762.1 hypothetical protein A9W95_08845 [Mycobacterium sp. 1423905.2]
MLLTILLTVLKVALLAFVVVGATAIVIRGVRRSRANRFDPRWREHRDQPGYEASAYGVMPRTPLPEWVHWDDDDDRGAGGRVS